MSTTAMEDKKIVATNEAKSRDLQAKINALHHIETVSLYTCLFSGIVCLMTLEGCERLYRADSNNRTRSGVPRIVTEGIRAVKRFIGSEDHWEEWAADETRGTALFSCDCIVFDPNSSVLMTNSLMRKSNSIGLRNMRRTRKSRVRKRSSACNKSMTTWWWTGEKMTSKLKKLERRRTRSNERSVILFSDMRTRLTRRVDEWAPQEERGRSEWIASWILSTAASNR